jgi:hypothetical protein
MGVCKIFTAGIGRFALKRLISGAKYSSFKETVQHRLDKAHVLNSLISASGADWSFVTNGDLQLNSAISHCE